MLYVLEKKNTEEVAWLKGGVWKLRGSEVRMGKKGNRCLPCLCVEDAKYIFFIFSEMGKWKMEICVTRYK